jgi:hypothetical protein
VLVEGDPAFGAIRRPTGAHAGRPGRGRVSSLWGRTVGALVSRRRLLWGGVATAAVAFACGSTLALPRAAEGARVLSAHELAIVRAVAEAMFPSGVFPVGGGEAKVAEEVDRLLSDWMIEPHRSAFRYILRVLEWGTLASRGSHFSSLDLADRQLVLDAWSDPNTMVRRASVDSLRVVMGMAYFGKPAVLDAIGWRTGCRDSAA